ncbi:hypothetical protein ACHHYP_12934 [Achlya hypogyna]|uniref:PH domain-containing protein n=1 Tax=Achlya hypogyna TaxID=1202772 RepID=A0A1V9ZGA9_ACHHY|nr:hypothetical protein ACHHYP_12934 [Achlya hypogyna]
MAALKEGYLTKRSANGKLLVNWRKRYFSLQPTELLYFEKKEATEPGRRTPLGPDASVSRTNDKGYKLTFVVKSSPTAENFYIQAASEEELNEWVDAIGKVVGKIEDIGAAATETEPDKVDQVGKEDVVATDTADKDDTTNAPDDTPADTAPASNEAD